MIKFILLNVIYLFAAFNVSSGQMVQNPVADSVKIDIDSDSLSADDQSKPYRSEKTIGGHLLSLPSYLFHWVTRPVGFSFKKAEILLPRLFEGERGDYGVFPLIELGGDTGYSYGLLLFHNRPFYPNHSARIEALFSSSDYNDIDFEYTIDRFLSNKGRLEIDAAFANRPDRTFLFGNDTNFDDRSFYDRQDIEAALSYSYSLTDNTVLRFNTDYLRREINRSDRQTDEDVPVFPENLLGKQSLLSTGLLLAVDNARGVPRINRGSRLITDIQWSRSL
ncbi:MAG: hypothetical protein WD008_03715, partial [Balneolaceae bacterium]